VVYRLARGGRCSRRPRNTDRDRDVGDINFTGPRYRARIDHNGYNITCRRWGRYQRAWSFPTQARVGGTSTATASTSARYHQNGDHNHRDQRLGANGEFMFEIHANAFSILCLDYEVDNGEKFMVAVFEYTRLNNQHANLYNFLQY
jgi:hypothetical protein